MREHTISIAYTEYHSAEELGQEDLQLLEKAWQACKSAYAPYSLFQVGAALRLKNGMIFTGNNQENAAYPSGLCAERVAAFTAASQQPGVAFSTIAVVAQTGSFSMKQPVTPCGACRQVLAEYESLSGEPVRVIMQGMNGSIWIVNGINNFLPLMFQGEQLKK